MKLAEKTKIPLSAVARAESSKGDPGITITQLDALLQTLRAGNVEFICDDDGSSGARLRNLLA